MGSKPKQDQNSPESDAPAEASSVSGIVQTIRELESQLQSLQQAQEETRARELSLQRKATDLAAREAAVSKDAEKIKTEQKTLEKLKQELAEREQQAGKKVEEAARLERDAAARAEELAAKQQQLAERLKGAEKTEQALKKQAEQVRAEQAALAHRVAQLEHEQAEQQKAVKQRLEALNEQTARLQEERAAFDEQRDHLGEDIAERQRTLREQQELVEVQLRQLEERGKDLEKRRASAEEARAALESDRREIKKFRAELAEQQRAAQAADKDAGNAATLVKESRARIDELEQQVERLKKQGEGAGAAEQAARAARDRVKQLEQEVKRLTADLDKARATPAAPPQGANGKPDPKARQRVQQLEEEIRRLQAQLEEAGNAESPRDAAKLEAALRARQTAESELKMAREKVAQLSKELESAARGAKAAPDDVAKRDQAIRLLKDRLDKAEAARADAERQLHSASARARSDAPATPAHLSHRRKRLANYRAAVQRRYAKIERAQETLKHRQAEYDKLLQQKAKLAKISETLKKREQKVAGAKTFMHKMAAFLFLAFGVVVLAGLSWAATDQVQIGTYHVRAEIQADLRGRQAADSELADWQAYHEQLVLHPQLMERAAAEMRRRGIAELGAPAVLADKLKEDLYTSSDRNGRLVFDYVSTGAGRAERELETYVVTLVNTSMAGRAQRTDGIATVLTVEPTGTADPVNQLDKIKVAGAIFGGAFCCALLFTTVVWGRLAGAKKKFEMQEAAASADIETSHAEWTVPNVASPR